MAEAKENTKGSAASKILMPLVAAAASAAAGWLARKAPSYLEETVLPKLREATQGAGSAAQKLPAQAKSVVSGTGDVAEDLAERARSVVGGGGRGGGQRSTRRGLSIDELERRRRERAAHRADRRKAS